MGAGADAAALELRGLTRFFGDLAAVRDVTETFRRGEYVCILGPSGCGKTTLLRLVAGFDAPSAGEVILDGRLVTGVPPERRDVNMVFQNYALFPHMTVEDNVAFGLRMRGVGRREAARRVAEMLELVGLRGTARRYPRELSGGQQQRVALARALVNEPRVLLLDEPLSALDRNLRLAMQGELRRIQRDVGITFLHVTHDQGEALGMADRVAVMSEGRFVQVGSPREIYRRPASRLVAEFLGSSNILPVGVDARERTARLSDGTLLRVAGTPDGARGAAGALVRPECVTLSVDRPPGDNVLEGTLTRVTYLGPVTDCRIRTPVGDVEAHVPSPRFDPRLRVGERVYVTVRPEDVVVLSDP